MIVNDLLLNSLCFDKELDDYQLNDAGNPDDNWKDLSNSQHNLYLWFVDIISNDAAFKLGDDQVLGLSWRKNRP